MNINFSTNGVILDTTNNETFLSFFKENDIDASISIININDPNNLLYINGINTKKYNNSSDNYDDFNMILNDEHLIASYYIFTNSVNEFDTSITFKYNNETIEVPIYNRPFVINSSDSSNGINTLSLNDNRTSAMMLRTNPKLTGNIKIVVDNNNKIYLDTFKVSDILSNKKYRKQEISCEDYYSNSVRNVFESLPKGDLYKINDNSFNAFNVLKTFEKQYDTTYIYGTKTNDDELYNENFSILAPLWVNEILPDYFLIFRVNDAYEDNSNLSATQIFKKYLSNGKLIKSFNLQENSPIGLFLRNHLSESNAYPGSVFIPFNNIDNISWYGIAVDKGVVTERVETPYYMSKINNQIWADNYLIEGFERNNLVSSKLLNLEFMFNDDESDIYSINRYFGIYVKRNDFLNGYYISYYNENNNSMESTFIDVNEYNTFFDSYKSNINFDINANINLSSKDRLICMVTPNNIYRLETNKSILNYLNSNNLLNVPDKNIINTPISSVDINKNPFLILKFNNVLNPGEHLRILGSYENGKNVIYEVIASNSELISNDPYVYNEYTINESYENIKIYRISFNAIVDDYEDKIAEQIKRIVNAFNKLNVNNDYQIITYNNKYISIINTNNNYNLLFQRINSNILNNNSASDNDITYFDDIVINKSIIKIKNEIDTDLFKFLPIDFEYWGDRETYIINFALGGIIINDNYNLYAINSDDAKSIDKITLYKNTNNSYSTLHNFEISYYTTNDGIVDTKNKINLYKNTILNYNDLSTTLICTFNDKISIVNNMFNGYSPIQISLSLMGYIPIKDFDFKIYDSTNLNLNFENNSKTLNLKNDYFNNDDLILLNPDSNVYTFTYNDGSITTNYNNDKYLLKNKIYKVISGQGLIFDKNNNSYTLYANDIFNTFDIENKFNYLIASKESDISIKLYNELDLYNSSNINLTNNSEDYFGNIFVINTDNESAKTIANNIFLNTGSVTNYNNIKNDYSNVQIPLVTPINTKWESIDINCTGKKTEFIWNLDKLITYNGSVISNFIPISYNNISLFNNNLLYASYKYMYNDPNKNKYVFVDLNDTIYNDNTVIDAIMNNDSAAINTLMYYNSDLKYSKFTIGYYNKFTDVYDFTIGGIKFNIKINNLSYLQNINLSNYNNYLITLVMNPSKNKKTNNPIEFIINETTKTILIIWYQGNDALSYFERDNTYILPKTNLDNNDNILNAKYDSSSLFQKERFIINYDTISIYDSSLIFPVSLEYDSTYKNNLNNLNAYLVQFNNNLYYDNSYSKYYNTINALLDYRYDMNNNYVVTPFKISNGLNYYNGFNTFNESNNQKINYYLPNNISKTYEFNTINYAYNINTNINVNTRSCSIELLNEQISNNLIDFYIIKNDNTVYINLHNDTILSTSPISVNIITPIVNGFINDVSCYTYNSFYNPKMIRMFDFNFNETDEVINLTHKNYILCNTNIDNIDNIKQLWINKVCYGNNYDEFDNQTISFDYIDSFNIMSSTWDNNYYFNYTYNANENKLEYNLPENYIGINVPYENKSYFGSKGIVLKNKNNNGSFTIKSWSKNNIIITNNISEFNNNNNALNTYSIKINLTQSFIDQMLSNNTFISNWKYFNSGMINNVIINYIKNSVLKYYIINNKNNLKIYYKEFNGNIIEYENNNFNDIVTNISTNITFENNNYYLTIQVPDNNKYTYYFEFKIDRKNI